MGVQSEPWAFWCQGACADYDFCELGGGESVCHSCCECCQGFLQEEFDVLGVVGGGLDNAGAWVRLGGAFQEVLGWACCYVVASKPCAGLSFQVVNVAKCVFQIYSYVSLSNYRSPFRNHEESSVFLAFACVVSIFWSVRRHHCILLLFWWFLFHNTLHAVLT